MECKINPQIVKALRRTRLWTQDELAVAAGLSLRTVQRAESDGAVSASSLKSLAAVFAVEAGELEMSEQRAPTTGDAVSPVGRGARWGVAFGMGGAILGYSMSLYRQIEAVQAGQMSADEFGLSAGILGAATGLVCAGIGLYYRHLVSQAPNMKT